jgi:aryl-alcohol dehydrogenase-like predicted oxidoreductase
MAARSRRDDVGPASRPAVAAPIASARTAEQLSARVAVAGLWLTEQDVAELTEASG